MAWCIEKSVVEGVIDNWLSGEVRGQIWLHGRADPVVLNLTGNPWRDLAGHRLRFANPNPEPLPGHMHNFAAEQTGVVGDMTAARKVKLLDIPDDQIELDDESKTPSPELPGNPLYLEWHSARNGRVVIESGDFELDMDPMVLWSMSEEEEKEQREANKRAMIHFMEDLAAAGETPEGEDPFEEEDCDPFPERLDEDAPRSQAEANADAEAARMDLLNDRIMARLEREPDADAEAYGRIMDEERERLRRERGEPEPETRWIPEYDQEFIETEEWNSRITETFAKEDEPIDDEPDYPLVEQCQELGHQLSEEIDAQGWLPEDAQEEHPLRDLVHRVWFAGAKLAGALHNGLNSWPPDALVAGNALVRLKKAREYLNDALAALETAREDRLAPVDWLDLNRTKIGKVRWEVSELIRDARRILRDAEDEPE